MSVLDPRICPACGDRAESPFVDEWPAPAPRTAPFVDEWRLTCRLCGHRWPFRRLPLFALTGPSGAGKSTVGPRLARELGDEVVVLEQDVLWTEGLRDDVDGHPSFRATWLRMIAMIHQSGRPVVLCGTVVPPEFERLPERVLFSDIHYLALVADPGVLAERLRARPAWREWSEPRIAEMLEFNDWLRARAATMEPPVRLCDTTATDLGTVVDEVSAWVRAHLASRDLAGT